MRDLNGNDRAEYCELYKDYLKIREYIKNNNKLLGNLVGNILFEYAVYINTNEKNIEDLKALQKKFYDGTATDIEKENFLDALDFFRAYTHNDNQSGKYEVEFDLSYEGFDGFAKHQVEGSITLFSIVNSRLCLLDGYSNEWYEEDSKKVYNPLFVGVKDDHLDETYKPMTNDIFEVSGYSRRIGMNLRGIHSVEDIERLDEDEFAELINTP